MSDPALRDRLRVAARDALGPYSPGVVAEQLQQVYAAVIAHQRPQVVPSAADRAEFEGL
jgi:hypothetical protein